MEIIPAIIPENLEDLSVKLRHVKGLAPVVQIDITDGKFVPEASWPFKSKETWKEFGQFSSGKQGLPLWEDFDFEADLMIRHPEQYVEDFISAGFSRMVIHYESTDDFAEVFDALEGRVEIGLGLEIDTPEEEVESYIPKVDFLQCMGIAEIGFQGQPFDERVIPKIKSLKEHYPDVTISIDGGVSFTSAPKLAKAGADRLVSGSTVFNAEDPKKAIAQLANQK